MQKIIIIDFGSQYTQLIARRIREAGVLSEIFFPDCSSVMLEAAAPTGVILSGGPLSTYETEALILAQLACTLNVPVLGICYGMQMLVHEFGGKIVRGKKAEYGRTLLSLTQPLIQSPLLSGIAPDELTVWMSHGDCVQNLPYCFDSVATSENSLVAVMQHRHKKIYGIQFHPEVTHTICGRQLLDNFLFEICACDVTWQPERIAEDIVADLKAQVGDKKVLLALSGGIDSSVTALLLHRAIGSQLICIFVDTGLLRLNEPDQVMALFQEHFDLNVLRVNAVDQFFEKLANVSEPEAKRKIIGQLFIDLFEAKSQELVDIEYLSQGTIYPDVIESAADQKYSKVIKSHHNVGGLPERMQLKLLEPLRHLFKDEVRKLGEILSLPKALLRRHPFPGPGLAVRVMGSIQKEQIEILKRADDIFIQLLEKHNLYDKVSQAFVVFLPVHSVGVVGDKRQYGYVLALRVIETTDFMTADWVYLSRKFLSLVATCIINALPEVSRVVYDISSKPPATIEWE